LAAVVLDFDGVVLESVDIKTRAFAALFEAEGPSVVGKLVAYHEINGGISRFEKFRWLYREILKRPLPKEEEASLGERFNALVEDAVMKAPFVPGAREFLEAAKPWPLFVASGTPQEELRRIVERRGLARHFRGVYGAPDKKDVILRRVAEETSSAPAQLVMVGDAINDFEAARQVGAAFIGVCGAGRSPFPPSAKTVLDLTTLEASLRAP
jgi:HAD superfamily hydrolase (TIGR01549 family)